LTALACEQVGGLGDVVDLPAGNPQIDRVAERVDEDVDLRREASARAT
jgi:hypothetical protein